MMDYWEEQGEKIEEAREGNHDLLDDSDFETQEFINDIY